ncbi:hypothetical protein KD909_03300 [Exiguobacterium sp. PFWT01]|uniref:hypothetical protein n=1 Tax=Exiguobacterium sp. PFWT01 TaxID=2829816 RepID=UPI001BA890F5|nr:hypothetical protein [Exiguobacterium sp. PFWT01]QUP87774.1 hypothetical protein KD909_03300 [Exiguobacterium sp. PFWT01]
MDLIEAIEAKDVEMIRRRLSTYIIANPNDEAMISRALSMIDRGNVPVWDSVDYFERKEKKDWNREYLTDAYAYLKTEHYSKALLLHITELARYLSPAPASRSAQGQANDRPRQDYTKETRMRELQKELIELENMNRRKGFNKQEKRRFDEIRTELKRFESNKHHTNSSTFMELLMELYQMVKRIVSGSERR